MSRVLSSIADHHNLPLVFLAVLVCLISSYTALSLLARANRKSAGTPSNLWLIGATFVTGSGIWTTHFIAMLGFQPGIPMSYDFFWTVISALVAVIASGIGYFIANHLHRTAIGGSIVGSAISAMHYIGMAAVRLPAQIHWDISYVIASLAIGIGLGAVSLKLAQLYPSWRGRFAATLILTTGICGMHFAGMASLSYKFDPAVVIPPQTISPVLFSVALTAVTMLIVGLGFIASLVDQYVAEINAAKDLLQRNAEKLAAALETANAANNSKSQFLAAMSHELRTPLNAIIGFSEIMKDQLSGPLNTRYCNYARDIFNSGSHLLSLVNDVLDITKFDAGHLSLNDDIVDLAQLIRDCVNSIELQAAKAEVAISAKIAPSIPQLRADERRLRQILLNLLSNAVKFTPPGGSVVVQLDRQDDGITLRVVDTGIGIASDDLPIAFARFGQIDSQLSRKYEGTGLGLPLTKHLVELHGGTLQLISDPGAGTAAIVHFGVERLLERRRRLTA
jgi:signal transduction histidine kinase